MGKQSFDYFYLHESEQFNFYRIPKVLVTGEDFRSLSTDAKLLYGLLMDRMSLSTRNGWIDQRGRVYIYYPIDEIEKELCCSHGKAVRLMSELDTGTGIGLIRRVRRGLGLPSIIYVKSFFRKKPPPETPSDSGSKIELLEVPKSDIKKSQNDTSGSSETEPLEVPKLNFPQYIDTYGSDTDRSDTDRSDTREKQIRQSYLYQSIYLSYTGDDKLDRKRVIVCIKENIGYVSFPENERTILNELVQLMADVFCSPQASFRIGGTQFKAEIVKKRLMELEQSHIEYVLESFQNTTTKIRNIRGYLLTALFNAPVTMENYYQAAVQHDLNNDKPENRGDEHSSWRW